jgi:hypothetical protein
MKSFLSDRQRLPLKPLVPPPATEGLARVTGPAMSTPAKRDCAAASGAAPQVETVKQGDKVVRLIVTCSCGERIEIDCLYPAGG